MDEIIKDIPMPPLPDETANEEVAPVQEEVDTPPVAEAQTEKQEPVGEKELTVQQKNFKSLREDNERLAHEKREALDRLEAFEKAAKREPIVEDSEPDIEIGDDDLFEGKHYKKIQRQLKKQKEELDKYREQSNATSTEAKLRQKYNDFDSVLTAENIERLRASEPEIAQTISSTQDIYTKAVSAYKMIKKLGIYVEDNFDKDREMAKQNSLKPKPLASVSPQRGDSPLTRANAFANGLTPELKANLLREMNEAAKGY